MRNIRKYFLAVFALLSCTVLNGQALPNNNLKVASFTSPLPGRDYEAGDKVEITVLLENIGPRRLPATDSVYFQYRVEYRDTVEVYNIARIGVTELNVGERAAYTLNPEYVFPENGDYGITAEPLGSSSYPANNFKQRMKSVSFPVNIEKVALTIDRIYFNNEKIKFTLNRPLSGEAGVFDLSGKLLKSVDLNMITNFQIELNAPAKGFYFLKVTDKSGSSTISKFVVN